MRLVGIGPVTGGPPATRIAQAMLDHYAVLRRTREPKDELPPAGRGHRPQRPGGGRFDVNPAFSRLVADRYGVKVWLVPGRHGVCVVQTLPRGGGAGACGPASFAGYYTGTSRWAWGPSARSAGERTARSCSCCCPTTAAQRGWNATAT